MKQKLLTAAIAVIMLLALVGCGSQNTSNTTPNTTTTAPDTPSKENVAIAPENPATGTNPATATNPATEHSTKRTIVDLGGNQVEIPAISDIENVVIITPPVTSILLNVIPDKDMIVGLSPKAFAFSNADLMKKLFPNFKDVETSFIGDNFAVNTESLLKLNPDIILYYGENQKKGIVNVGLPIIDFFPKGKADPRDVSIAWDNLLREIFASDMSESLQTEWEALGKKSADLLAARTGEPKSALCVFSNVGGSLVVSGSSSFDSYAESFFNKAGLRNVAADIQGTAEVSMEQIYQWNPDMIFVFHNAPAQALLNNKIEGQDWSLLNAWQNKAIYDIPQTAYSWITPCADSPLLPLWLISKAYPELFSEAEFRTELGAYYDRFHQVTLTETEIDSILAYRKAQP